MYDMAVVRFYGAQAKVNFPLGSAALVYVEPPVRVVSHTEEKEDRLARMQLEAELLDKAYMANFKVKNPHLVAENEEWFESDDDEMIGTSSRSPSTRRRSRRLALATTPMRLAPPMGYISPPTLPIRMISSNLNFYLFNYSI